MPRKGRRRRLARPKQQIITYTQTQTTPSIEYCDAGNHGFGLKLTIVAYGFHVVKGKTDLTELGGCVEHIICLTKLPAQDSTNHHHRGCTMITHTKRKRHNRNMTTVTQKQARHQLLDVRQTVARTCRRASSPGHHPRPRLTSPSPKNTKTKT